MVNFISEFSVQDIAGNKVRKLRTRSIRSQVKDAIFEGFNAYFKPKYRYKMKYSIQMGFEISMNSIYCLQLLTLVLHPGVKISEWDRYSLIWYIISYFRFDNICADLKGLHHCFYGSSFLITFGFISLCITSLMCYWKRSINGNLIYLPGKILEFLSTIGYLPALMINLIVIKYSFYPESSIDEYNSHGTLNMQPISAFWGIIGLIDAFLLYFFAITHELFTADVCHSFAERNIRARADTGIDIKVLGHKTAIAIIYVYAGISNITLYHLYIMISTGFLSYLMFTCNSYFNPFVDALKISVMLGISIFDAFFLLALWIDDAGVVVLLSIVIFPLIFAANIYYISKLSKSYANSPKEVSNQHNFELNMRHMLIDRSGKFNARVVEKFIEIYKKQIFFIEKLLVAWEVNYCIHTIKDLGLARIKFARMTHAKASMDGVVQEWRIKKWLDNNKNENFCIETDFLFYLIDLEEAEKDDEKLCCDLISLWNEVTCKKPRLGKLESLAHKVSKLIEKLKDEYMSLIAYKHAKAFELYGSFLMNVLNEHQFGNLIMNKRNSFKNPDFKSKSEKRLTRFDDENGIILISASKKDLGEIVYINQKAAEILEENIHSATGNKIWQYIPNPYQDSHRQYMTEWIENCKSTEVPTPNALFFLNQMGFLVDCQVLIKLTAFNGYLYFMATLKIVQSLRQVALISENGFIYHHSSHFLEYLNFKKIPIGCQYIQKILPEINFEAMTIYEPEMISPNGIDIAAVHCIKNYSKTRIHYILLITDPTEIKQWNKGLDYNQQEYFKRQESFFDSDNLNTNIDLPPGLTDSPIIKKRVHLTREENTDISQTIELSRIDEIAKKRKFSHIDDRSITASILQSNSSSVAKTRGKSTMIKSETSLKRFKWILFISMIIVIATNIAISVYISEAVNHSKSFNSFKDLAIILYRLASMAEISRSIYFSIKTNIDFNENLDLMNDAISEMSNYHQALRDDAYEWSYCPSSDIVSNDIMASWTASNKQEIIYTNLLDEIQDEINTANKLVIKAKNNETFDDEMRYLISNGLENVYQQTNSSLRNLVRCEINRISEISNTITILMVAGICVLGFCTIILVYYIFYISKKYNVLWNFIKTITHSAYFELKRSCLERLCSIHGNDYNQDEVDSVYRNKEPDEKLTFKENQKFIMRLSIFLLQTAAYYIVVHAVLFSSCEDLLHERPKLLTNYIRRRALVPTINFWSRESAVYGTPIGLQIIFSESVVYENPDTELDKAINLFKLADAELIDYMHYMSNSLRAKLYEHSSAPNYQYKYGGLWLNNLLTFDSLALKHIEDDKMQEMMKTTRDYAIIQQAMATNFDIINKSSENMISDKLNSIIYAVVMYALCCLILYFFYYLPYLSREIKRLYKLQLIIAIIPKV
ncbi:unnamed protein product [Blepharisma stoltei]|uniref:TmcB/TmcC TPR repeats domain-containing protein n=1 Tax=Blepharisma stoltei TaxID=1481888 RepID=A0AAU9JE97_9CILI|nr:unnamed protein product [Blepharisma stoltei]